MGPVAHHESLPYQQEEELPNQQEESQAHKIGPQEAHHEALAQLTGGQSPSDAAFQQMQQQKEAEAAQAEAMKQVGAQREAALRARVMQRPLSNMGNRQRGQGPASRNNQRRGF